MYRKRRQQTTVAADRLKTCLQDVQPTRRTRGAAWRAAGVLAGVTTIVVVTVGLLSRASALSERDTRPPRTPQGLEVAVDGTSVEASWKPATEEDIFTYVVDIRPVGAQPQERLVGRTDRAAAQGLPSGSRVLVRVAAQDGAGNRSAFTSDLFVRVGETGGIAKASAWIPIGSDGAKGRATFAEHASLFTTISPFQYDVQADGTIRSRGEVSADLIATTRTRGMTLLPTVTNVNSPGAIAAILSEPEGPKHHADAIVAEVMASGVDGVDLDYEGIPATLREPFTVLVRATADRLHAKGKRLSVTVQTKTSDTDITGGAAGIDYTSIAAAADEIRIMAYDAARPSTLPGPVAPLPWVANRVAYALTRIPTEKLVVGLPLYGYHWCLGGGKAGSDCRSTGIGWDGVQKILAEEETEIRWDVDAQTSWLRYQDADGNENVVYYEDARSIAAKLEKLVSLGASQVSFWRLGLEDPAVFDKLRAAMRGEQGPKQMRVLSGDGRFQMTWQDATKAAGATETNTVATWRLAYREAGQMTATVVLIEAGKTEAYVEGLENGTQLEVFLERVDTSRTDTVPWPAVTDQPVALVTPSDVVPPSAVTDVRIEREASTFIELGWTVPEGTPVTYDLRVAKEAISDRTFWSAVQVPSVPTPGAAGEEQRILLRGLTPGSRYTVAMRSADAAGNVSDVSNALIFSTKDTLPPQIPKGLRGIAGDTKVTLSWTPNSEEDLRGYRLYVQEGDNQPVVVETGAQTTDLVVPGLENRTDISFQIAAFDGSGNESGKSEKRVWTPQAQGWQETVSGTLSTSLGAAQATLQRTAISVFRPGAIPYLAMGSVLLFNIFLFKGMRNDLSGDLIARRTREDRRLRETLFPSMNEIRQTRTRVVPRRQAPIPSVTMPETQIMQEQSNEHKPVTKQAEGAALEETAVPSPQTNAGPLPQPKRKLRRII